MNVAVTRAKALLIIIGCADTLKVDENWRELLRYYKKNNAVAGESFNLQIDLPEVPANGVNDKDPNNVNVLVNNLDDLHIME